MKKTKKGSVLAYSLIILSIMLAIVATISAVTVMEKKGASSTTFSTQAYQTADSGIQLAMQKIKQNQNGTIYGVFENNCKEIDGVAKVEGTDAGLGGESSYTLTFFDKSATLVQISDCDDLVVNIGSIKSVGEYKDTVRAIQIKL